MPRHGNTILKFELEPKKGLSYNFKTYVVSSSLDEDDETASKGILFWDTSGYTKPAFVVWENGDFGAWDFSSHHGPEVQLEITVKSC